MTGKIDIIKNGIWIFFVYLLASCGDNKDIRLLNVIPVASTVGKYSILNLSDYVSEIKYIPLETNESVLLGDIVQMVYENEKNLIRDKFSNSFLFDDNGNFCCKIGQRGQGPDEYLSGAQVLMYDDLIFQLDRTKILIYNSSGVLDAKIHFGLDVIPAEYTSHGAFYIMPLKKDTFVFSVISMNGYYPKAILLESDQSNIKMIKEYPNYLILDKASPGISTDEFGFMYRFKDEVRTYKLRNDTIFTINQDTEIKDAFIFELKNYKPTLSFLQREEDYITSRKKYIIPTAICESINYLFIRFHFGNYAPEPIDLTGSQGNPYQDTDVYGVFDKRTGKLTLMRQPVKGKLGFKNDIDNGPVIWPRYISANNELVTYISVPEFMDYYKKIDNPSPQLTAVANQIDMDDNQIVIIAKLKE
jgi:hypothetical protein